jgi:hypothetical protein
MVCAADIASAAPIGIDPGRQSLDLGRRFWRRDQACFARNCMGVVPVQRLNARTSAAGSE